MKRMKCEVCKASVDETFLGKPLGGYVKDAKGKAHLACSACQKRLGSKEVLLDALK